MQGLNSEVETQKMKHDRVVGLLNREKDHAAKLEQLLDAQQQEAQRVHVRDRDAINQLQQMLGRLELFAILT